jgi:hypothetical protein
MGRESVLEVERWGRGGGVPRGTVGRGKTCVFTLEKKDILAFEHFERNQGRGNERESKKEVVVGGTVTRHRGLASHRDTAELS